MRRACAEKAVKWTGYHRILWPTVFSPLATAAVKALESKNVNLILPFAPAEAEADLMAAFDQAAAIRAKGPEAKALGAGKVDPLLALLSHHVEHGITEHFVHARHAMDASKEPAAPGGVAAAGARVSAELALIGYVESIYQAIKGGQHHE